MVEIVHGRDGAGASGPGLTKSRDAQTDAAFSASGRLVEPPRTDIGTLTLHLVTAIAFAASLITGIRIAADALHAPVSKWLSHILPQGEIWTVHFYAGLTLFFCSATYFIYMRRSGLGNRNALKKTRIMVMPVAARMRFSGLNVVLHWAAYLIICVMTVTGIFLYLGHGGWLVQIHSYVAFIGLFYIFVHALSHYLFGGWWQVFRVFRPAKLVRTAAMKPKPLLIAAVTGVAVVAGIAASDTIFRDTLLIRRVAVAPDVRKLLDDPIWASVVPVQIRTQQGINLGGTGDSLVEVRALHDGEKIYFAFRWEDPTRSLRREPLIKKEDGWHIVANNTFTDDVTTFYEDKFAVIFSTVNDFGAGGVSHLGPKPLADYQGSRNGRGLHYTDGHMVDMWQWKASRGGLLGEVDDMYIGPPRPPTPSEIAQVNRYQAGYWGDPGDTPYTYNFKLYKPSEYTEDMPVEILRLPKDYNEMNRKMGSWNPEPGGSVDDGSVWWMYPEETVPYSKEADAKIPIGTIIPAVLITGKREGDRYDVKATAHWANGYWTLIASRDLKTGSKYDQDFLPGKDLYMWVAVFDHTQTRHTRHARPIKITTQE